jgi:DNA mismatch endonuclease (patch repair protein)
MKAQRGSHLENKKKPEPRFRGETSAKRSKNMSHIKGSDTSIEIALRKALWSKGYRYRKNYKQLPGKPDIALTKYKIAIFCDGEFFHGKDWEILKPRLLNGKNPDYWVPKIERNMERDQKKDKELLFLGWTVIHFWGKDILKDTEECLRVIEETIFDQEMQDNLEGEDEFF